MYEPDIKKFAAELNELKNTPPVKIEIPLLSVFSIIAQIQSTADHPEVKDKGFTDVAMEAVCQLQELFDPESEIYKVLELGWSPNCNEPLPQPPCSN